MKTTILQPTVAALAAACLAVPVTLAPSAQAAAAKVDAGSATADSGAVASVPNLKLVLAELEPGAGTAAASTGPQFEILALPEDIAAQVETGGIAAVPSAVAEQGREAAALVLGDAGTAAGADTLVTSSVFLDLLGLPITTALAIVAGINPPPTFPNPAQYTSVYTVINNAISVLRAPLAALLTGQFDLIAPQTAAAWATFMTSVTTGLPASIGASVAYASEVIAAALGTAVTQGTVADAAISADTTADVQAAATPAALLDLLGLPITTTLAIVAGINPPPTFPNPAQYTSVYTVINNAISVLRAPLAALVTGQFNQVGPQTSAAWSTFATSLTVGLPASVNASVAYAGEVIAAALGGGAAQTADTASADTAFVVEQPSATAPSLSALADQFAQFVPDLGAKSALGANAAAAAQSLDAIAGGNVDEADDTVPEDAAPAELPTSPAEAEDSPSSNESSSSAEESDSAERPDSADKDADEDKAADEDEAADTGKATDKDGAADTDKAPGNDKATEKDQDKAADKDKGADSADSAQ